MDNKMHDNNEEETLAQDEVLGNDEAKEETLTQDKVFENDEAKEEPTKVEKDEAQDQDEVLECNEPKEEPNNVKKEKKPKKGKVMRVTDTLSNILLAVLLIILILLKTGVIGLYTVSGSSMQPTMRSGERTLSFSFTEINHGDIVYVDLTDTVFKYKLVKRVIGLPGDTLTFSPSNITRNGVLLEEDYIFETPNYSEFIDNCSYGEHKDNTVTFTLGEDEYFIMGDNRNHSNDSREPEIGPISKDRILGEYAATLYYKQPLEIEFTIEDFENMD